jgi:hypothetical protein
LGAFTSFGQNYSAGGTAWTTTSRLYGNSFVIFEQTFPDGAEATAVQVCVSMCARARVCVCACARACVCVCVCVHVCVCVCGRTRPCNVHAWPREELHVSASSFELRRRHIPSAVVLRGLVAVWYRAQGEVSSCFPSINPTVVDGTPRGYVSWQGRFMEASRGGVWQGGSGSGNPGVATGGQAGPFVVFGDEMTDSLVFSVASNFMTHTTGMSPVKGDESVCFGLDGPVTSVPAGYSLETMVFLGVGVNSALKSFGTTLLRKYQTVRPEDYSTKWLGYSTGT